MYCNYVYLESSKWISRATNESYPGAMFLFCNELDSVLCWKGYYAGVNIGAISPDGKGEKPVDKEELEQLFKLHPDARGLLYSHKKREVIATFDDKGCVLYINPLYLTFSYKQSGSSKIRVISFGNKLLYTDVDGYAIQSIYYSNIASLFIGPDKDAPNTEYGKWLFCNLISKRYGTTFTEGTYMLDKVELTNYQEPKKYKVNQLLIMLSRDERKRKRKDKKKKVKVKTISLDELVKIGEGSFPKDGTYIVELDIVPETMYGGEIYYAELNNGLLSLVTNKEFDMYTFEQVTGFNRFTFSIREEDSRKD